MFLLSLGVLLPLAGLHTMLKFKDQGQRVLDAQRKSYDITFPLDMDEKQIHAFIRAIGSNLRGGSTWQGRPTMVFEVSASPQGIRHRLRVPADDAAYLIGQLQNTLPGIEVTSADHEQVVENFQYGAQLYMANSTEELPIVNAVDYSYRLLGSMQDAVQSGDQLSVQWIIAHSDNQKMPPSDKPVTTTRTGALSWLFGEPKAGRDELASRRSKQRDQTYIATARIAARGASYERSQQLVRQVVRAYTSEGGTAHFYAKGVKTADLNHDMQLARTPLYFSAQLSVKELAAVIAWPMNNQYVPGLNRGSTRHLPAQETVPRGGRLLGSSTMPGLDRSIAMSYEAAASHMYIAGGTGVGKTTLMVNTIRQDMETGAGIILIEREGNLFQQALDQVPPHRIHDVICIDLSRSDRPVGLNLLRTNKPEIVAGQLAALLNALYPDNKSIYTNQYVQQGIPVLANLDRATIADLISLVYPTNPVEKAWAKWAVAQMPDKQYREYWENEHKKLEGRDTKEIERNVQPLKNRLWEILTPEPVRYLLNQETNSFEPADVIRGNKLLFVNLAGVSEQVASLVGTMIVTALWTAAKTSRPDRPNFMYLDEFQQFSHLSQDFEDMLATARKRNLGLVIATQYIERLKRETQDAVMANARTKVIFNSSAGSASIHAQDFASQHVRRENFMNLKAHEALARINTASGISEPITLRTYKEPDGYGRGAEILDASARTYGRDKAAIDKDDASRRVAPKIEAPVKKEIGRSSYNTEGQNDGYVG